MWLEESPPPSEAQLGVDAPSARTNARTPLCADHLVLIAAETNVQQSFMVCFWIFQTLGEFGVWTRLPGCSLESSNNLNDFIYSLGSVERHRWLVWLLCLDQILLSNILSPLFPRLDGWLLITVIHQLTCFWTISVEKTSATDVSHTQG